MKTIEGLTVTYWQHAYDADVWFFTFECENEKVCGSVDFELKKFECGLSGVVGVKSPFTIHDKGHGYATNSATLMLGVRRWMNLSGIEHDGMFDGLYRYYGKHNVFKYVHPWWIQENMFIHDDRFEVGVEYYGKMLRDILLMEDVCGDERYRGDERKPRWLAPWMNFAFQIA